MTVSIFTTITDPDQRGDNWMDAFRCYEEMADEVAVINGGGNLGLASEKVIYQISPWPQEFSWEFIGQQFQRGYEACTGDWVIRMDLDTIFHEKDFERIRDVLEREPELPCIAFSKYQFILPDRFNVKSRLILAVNKRRFGDRIRFDSGDDLCQVSLDGYYIKPSDFPTMKVSVWNYECLLKTRIQLLEDKGRFARAWQRQFGEYKLGGPDNLSAYEKWLEMVKGRFAKPHQKIALSSHPKYIQDTIKNLTSEQWGYSGFGLIKEGVYAQGY